MYTTAHACFSKHNGIWTLNTCQFCRVSIMSDQLPTPAVGKKLHRPTFFHFREFGRTSVAKWSFQPQLFTDGRRSLHYKEDKDLAFGFSCVTTYQNKHLHSVTCLERTFISTGFSNWKDVVVKFTKHEGSLAGQTLTQEERIWSNSHQAFVLHSQQQGA